MRLQITMVKEATRSEDESHAVVKTMMQKGGTLMVADSFTIPEGMSQSVKVPVGCHIVVEYPAKKEEVVEPVKDSTLTEAVPPPPSKPEPVKASTPFQTQVQQKTVSVPTPPSFPLKPIEKDKDTTGNPVPAVDTLGPTTHAPPPNAPKKD